MAADVLTIWTNTHVPPDLNEKLVATLSPHRLIQAADKTANNLAGAAADPGLATADIALGQPHPKQVAACPKLKLVQLTTAGYTRYDTAEFRDAVKRNGTAVCNASSVYAEPCAQHALAMMLAFNRRLPQSLDNQRGPRDWPYLPLRSESKLLNGQTVLLVGYGAIARRLGQLLAPFEMNLIGFRRNPAGDENGVRMLHIGQLDDWLGRADHVVNILPLSRETEQFFNIERLAKLKRSAYYYNIGRGATNDEYALWTALETGHFAAAYIDAFAAEPLPKDDPLWHAPRCFITPHTAGGHANEYERHVEFFLDNLRRFRAGEEVIDRIM
jgi:phosphoglycerate dehydrogenase-like enzyme